VFTLAAITDWVDGYLARRLGQMTAFGAFLDPVADKLMVAVALVLLVERHNDLLFTLAACVIIGREIVVSALREWMAELGKRTSVAVSMIGKVKTTFQMVAIIVLLAVDAQRDGSEVLAIRRAAAVRRRGADDLVHVAVPAGGAGRCRRRAPDEDSTQMRPQPEADSATTA
jgi:CDP-diacylglycerol--glycerol-3-phosphate 3-phosphatidyltransferase